MSGEENIVEVGVSTHCLLQERKVKVGLRLVEEVCVQLESEGWEGTYICHHWYWKSSHAYHCQLGEMASHCEDDEFVFEKGK